MHRSGCGTNVAVHLYAYIIIWRTALHAGVLRPSKIVAGNTSGGARELQLLESSIVSWSLGMHGADRGGWAKLGRRDLSSSWCSTLLYPI